MRIESTRASRRLRNVLLAATVLSILLPLGARTFGQQPYLPDFRSAAGLAVYAGTAISNASTTSVYGDVSVPDPFRITGLDPNRVFGTLYDGAYISSLPEESILRLFQTDVAAADQQLRLNRNGMLLLGNQGNGLNLPPGVYRVASDLQIGGALHFDARGNANAAWVFIIPSSFTVNPITTYDFVNGADPSNVYWVCRSAVLGRAAALGGTIIADRDVFFGAAATMLGRAMSVHGTIALNGNTIHLPGFVPKSQLLGMGGSLSLKQPSARTDASATMPTLTDKAPGWSTVFGRNGGNGIAAQCQYSVTSNFGSPTTGTGWTVGTGSQTDRIYRDGVTSTCAGKTCPGSFGAGSPIYFDKYTFTNQSLSTACVTVTMTLNTGTGYPLHPAAYTPSYTAGNFCLNYVGDSGGSPGVGAPGTFSFNVPSGADFVIVIEEVAIGAGPGSNYTLVVSGNICPDIIPCAENFDGVTAPALPVGWTATNVQGSPTYGWVTSTAQSYNAPNSAFVMDPPTTSENILTSKSMQIVSPTAQMTFYRYYYMESSFDGVVLEISINGGAWQDIVTAGGSFVTGGYTGTINNGPLNGRSAWTGSYQSWTTVIVNLPAAANNQPIQLRWHSWSDSSVGYVGFFLDNISITGSDCSACQLQCSNITVNNTPGKCDANVSFTIPSSGTCGTITCVPPSGFAFPVGNTLVTCTPASGPGCSFTVKVNDTEPPTIQSAGNITVYGNDPTICGVIVANTNFGVVATDNCPGVILTNNIGPTLGQGVHNILWIAIDASGNTAAIAQTVTVVDGYPPSFYFALYPTTLIPSNQTMRSITAAISLVDNCPGATFKLESITSTDPDAGMFAGDMPNDIQAAIGSATTSFLLRAERGFTSRRYTITYSARDAQGNSSRRTSYVVVPAPFKEGEPDATLPHEVQLDQNVPNPFATMTNVRFSTPEDGYVHLAVYDLLGRQVATLYDGWLASGPHAVTFDGGRLPDGNYIAVLQAGGTTVKRTMSLVR